MFVTSPMEVHDAVPSAFLASGTTGMTDGAATKTIRAGELLFYEGDDSTHIYEIVEGVVRSTKLLCDGRRQVMSFGYPGDLVGVSHDCHYHSDCEALSHVVVRVHRRNACSATVASDPAFCERLLKHTAREMNEMQEHFLMLGRKSALERVASFLVALMERTGEGGIDGRTFALPMSRTDIADFLGMTIETVSRTLTKLRKEGVIQLTTVHRVVVLRPASLRAMAERDG